MKEKIKIGERIFGALRGARGLSLNEDYENEMVLTSNQLELELESKDFDWWEILEITLPPRDLGPTRGYQV